MITEILLTKKTQRSLWLEEKLNLLRMIATVQARLDTLDEEITQIETAKDQVDLDLYEEEQRNANL